MFRNNVMSFIKKMGMTQDAGTSGSSAQGETGGTFSRFLGNIGKPTNPTNPDPAQPSTSGTTPTTESAKPKSEASGLTNIFTDHSCRVCWKKFGPNEDSITCCDCKHKICEDCASYSSTHDPSWRCSVCRRKVASREQQLKAQESTDSLLDIPIETLHRRHSDARLGASNKTVPFATSTLAPPRQEIRRHSDVSPASLKELEKFRKVAGDPQGSEAESDRNKSTKPRVGELPNRDQRAIVKPAQKRAVEHKGISTTAMAASGAQFTHSNTGVLGLSVRQRRASAYDVYAVPGSSGMATHQITSFPAQGKAREPEDWSTTRRSSSRVVDVTMLYDDDITADELDASCASQTVFMPDEETRNRRRGSQLPDINAIRHNVSLSQAGAAKAAVSAGAVGRYAAAGREQHRQRSLMDGESIKIVVQDVDNDDDLMMTGNRIVQLRRDPLIYRGFNKSCGFGLKVITGKVDSEDGNIYPYIEWTVPGGPAERAGLQQGDKILQWCGISIVNRCLDEVQQIINQSTDLVELVVEQMPDTFGIMDPQGKTSNTGLLKEKEMEKMPSSPTRRRLPKTPK